MNNKKYNSLDEILCLYLTKKEEDSKLKRDNDWWWASELGTCLRKQFLRRLGINPIKKEFRIIFLGELGNEAHNWISGVVQEMGALIVAEHRLVIKKYKFKGRLDMIINLGTDKNPYLSLVDVKTQRPEAFYRRAKLPVGERVKSFQKKQLASYFYFAKKEWPDLKDARIYYLDRGGGVREEYIFKFGQKMFDEVLDELNSLNQYWKNKKVPPCSETWMCQDYCRPCKKELIKVEKGELTLKEFLENHGRKKR